MRLGQPNWIAYLTFETTFLKAFQCSGRVSRPQEEIQVLGEATDSGIMPQSKCPRHSVGKTLFLKRPLSLIIEKTMIVGRKDFAESIVPQFHRIGVSARATRTPESLQF